MCTRVIQDVLREDPGWQAQAARHLQTACSPIQQGHTTPRVPPAQLKQIATEEGVRAIIPRDPVWRYQDQSGQWYCPYCIQSGVRISRGSALTESDVAQIVQHVTHCFYFDGGRGTPKAADAIVAAVKQADSKLVASRDLRRRLTEDPVWRVRDRNGCWVCPYCRRPVLAVNFLPSRPETAIEAVSVHLVGTCPAYRAGREPARDASELTAGNSGERAVARTVAERKAEFVQVEKQVYEMLVRIAKEHVTKTEEAPDESRTLLAARQTQMKMLPKAPSIPGFEIDVLYRPSHQLSGDFYDFIPLDGNHLGFLIGDVSGHGIDAALVMGVIKKVLHLAGRMQSEPKRMITYGNEVIRPDLKRGTFITACCGVLDLTHRAFRFSNAGHNPVLLYNRDRVPQPVALRPAGIALGIVDSSQMESSLEEMEVPLEPGDVVLQYTDGVVEQANPAGERVRIEGLMELMQRESDQGVPHLLGAIDRFLTQYRGEIPQGDDITVVCFRAVEPAGAAKA
jgi:serine phosphatase RsbU (regulator of sigma subunit)